MAASVADFWTGVSGPRQMWTGASSHPGWSLGGHTHVTTTGTSANIPAVAPFTMTRTCDGCAHSAAHVAWPGMPSGERPCLFCTRNMQRSEEVKLHRKDCEGDLCRHPTHGVWYDDERTGVQDNYISTDRLRTDLKRLRGMEQQETRDDPEVLERERRMVAAWRRTRE